MKKLLLIGFSLMSLLFASNADAKGVIFVLDSSGSMFFKLHGIKQNILRTIASPGYAMLALGLLNFIGCPPEKTFAYPVKVDHYKEPVPIFKSALDQITGNDNTDILGALRKTKEIVVNYYQNQKECLDMLLFTDSADTCGNSDKDIQAAIQEIQDFCDEDKKKFKIDIITTENISEKDLNFWNQMLENADVEGEVLKTNSFDERQKMIEDIMKKKLNVPQIRRQYTDKERKEDTQEENEKKDRERKQPERAPAQQGGSSSDKKEGGN